MLFLRTHILGFVSASPAGAGGGARQEDRKSTVHPPPTANHREGGGVRAVRMTGPLHSCKGPTVFRRRLARHSVV